MQRLKISFDGLDQEEKHIFIDIACLFNKKYIYDAKSTAILIWKASGWSAEHAVQTLQDKCLIEVSSDQFEMHDHLRDLGRQMADDLGPPRLWRPDILRSMEAKGFKQILTETKGRCFHWFKDSSLKSSFTFFLGNSNDSTQTDLLWLEIYYLEDIPSWIPLRKLQYLSDCHVKRMWSTFQQQLQTHTQASFELRKLRITGYSSLLELPDLLGLFSRLEELEISGMNDRNYHKKIDIGSFVQSLKQLGNLRSLNLDALVEYFFSGNLNLSKDTLETCTSSCMTSLETVRFHQLDGISKLLISGEMCPKLRSLTVDWILDLEEMDLKQLERLNELEVSYCDKLKTITGLSSLAGLQSLTVSFCGELKTITGLSYLTELQSLTVSFCIELKTITGLSSLTGLQSLAVICCGEVESISGLSSLAGLQKISARCCKRLKSLPTLAHQRHLEPFIIKKCNKLQSVEGFEELQVLKSLIIDMPKNGYAWVRKCIHGLRRLPSENTILTGVSTDTTLSRLDVNLFSEVIGVQAVDKMEGGLYRLFHMRSSSSAITIYAFCTGDMSTPVYVGGVSSLLLFDGKEIITVLLTHRNSELFTINNIYIEKGFKVTLNEGEEGKALTLMQIIVDQLYGEG